MNGRGLAVVVTHNSAATLEPCLASLMGQVGVEFDLAVVDNASTDGTVEMLRAQRFPIRIVARADNLGFGRANNLAIEGSDAAWFGLVNPDAFLRPDAFATCLDVLSTRPEVAVVGLRHRAVDGGDQPSAFPFLDLRNLAGEALALDRVFPRAASLSTRRPPGFDPARATDVDWVQGSFLFVRGDVVREVGGFDPRFFMYGEDMEWCRRIRARGHAIRYLPEPVLAHVGGSSGHGQAPRLYVEHWKGRLLYFDLYRGPLARALARGIVAGSIGLRWIAYELAVDRVATAGKRELFRAAMRWVLAGQPSPSARS